MDKFCIANWKMQLTIKESCQLAKELRERIDFSDQPKVVICPTATALSEVAQVVGNSSIKLGAQNMSWLERGSLTGEVSALTLQEIGVEYVILGHSERRNYLREDSMMIKDKLLLALRLGLRPVLCVGEKEEERLAGATQQVIVEQLESVWPAQQTDKIIVAYEPVWAIGTGQTVSLEQAEEVAALIKNNKGADLPVLYGGSVQPDNIGAFAQSDKLAGVLVGGASLQADSFVKIINAFI